MQVRIDFSIKQTKNEGEQSRDLAHSVLAEALSITSVVLSIKLKAYGDIEITLVLLVWSVLQKAGDRFLGTDGEDITQVEYGLFPVGVFGVWAG